MVPDPLANLQHARAGQPPLQHPAHPRLVPLHHRAGDLRLPRRRPPRRLSRPRLLLDQRQRVLRQDRHRRDQALQRVNHVDARFLLLCFVVVRGP